MAPRFRHKKPHSALKHGGYSALGLLPGESPAEFEQLHKRVTEELAPSGPLEEDIVSTLARLLWRKQNRSTFRNAELARNRLDAIIHEETARRNIPKSFMFMQIEEESEEVQAAREEAQRVGRERAQKELGDLYELTTVDVATDDRLLTELAVEERVDALIDKCIKRLLMVRGVKSMAIQMPSESPKVPEPRSVNRSVASS
jgi:hypothetical protein